jgi:hypothetical protein
MKKTLNKEQMQYLGAEYQRQQREKEMLQSLDRDRKMEDHYKIKKEEQHVKSVNCSANL